MMKINHSNTLNNAQGDWIIPFSLDYQYMRPWDIIHSHNSKCISKDL